MRIEGIEVNTNQDVESLLKQIRSDPRTGNPRVLAINQLRQMQAKNNGYPLDLYHVSLLPIRVLNEEEETAMTTHGYGRAYIHRDYPRYMFRRNMHPKFQKPEPELKRLQTMVPEARALEMAMVNENDYIEEKVVNSAKEENDLMREKPRKGITTAWVSSIGKVEPFADEPEEDPAITIANLRGQLEAREAKSA